MERPGKVMPPQKLRQGPLEKLQLVCHAAWPARIFHRGLWWDRRPLGHRVRQRWTLKVLVQQGGLANSFARASVLVHPANGQPNQRAGGVEAERDWEKENGKELYLYFI